MRKLLFVAGLSCLLWSKQASAQEWFKPNSNGGGFNFSFGYQAFDGDQYFGNNPYFQLKEAIDGDITDTKNYEIYRATYAQPSNSLLTTGFQGYGVFNSIVMGGELQAGLGSAKTGTQYDTLVVNGASASFASQTSSRFVTSNVLFNIGYIAMRKRGVVLYPLLGLGYGASGIWLKSSSTNNRIYPAVTDVVSVDDRNLQNMMIWTRSFLMDFGLGCQFMLGASTEDRAKGFSLGLRLGYQVQLATDDIKVNFNKKAIDSYKGSDVSLPKIGNSGFYIKMLIGFGKIGEAR